MMNKQELVTALLCRHLSEIKVGIIVKGVDDILPEEIIKAIASEEKHLYAAAIGYDEVIEHSDELYDITGSIEKAVLWRSMPECAGSIIVFIRNDTDKLHSLAEFEVITTRDTARYLVETQIKSDNNTPTNNFWTALQTTSDYYTFDALYDFVSAVAASDNHAEAIPQNMWRLNLLEDREILGSKSNPLDRLAKNRDLIFAIGQLSEDSRKKLSRSLVRTKAKDKERLQKAYRSLQNLYKYGSRDTLKALDLETVQELFSASQKTEKKKIVFSAIQPSGTITLGNYLGAIKNWAAMQEEFNCIFALADEDASSENGRFDASSGNFGNLHDVPCRGFIGTCLAYANSDGMGADGFGERGVFNYIFLAESAERFDARYPEFALRQRSGLIEDGALGFCEKFKIVRAFYENSVL